VTTRPGTRLRGSTRLPAGGAARPPRRPRLRAGLQPLLWLGPSLLLIVGVVAYPAATIVVTSLQRISVTGLTVGWAGLGNYAHLLALPALPQVLVNTLVWVAISVVVTTVLALAIAALLNERFPGRKLIRTALLLPWAASVTITAIGFKWIFNYYYGALNPLLQGLGIISGPVDWLGSESTFMAALVGVTVFVSVPFTVYVLLAGLQSLPGELREAAAIDGANWPSFFRYISLPWLRPYLVIESVLNGIWIFNSFAIVWVLNSTNPGYTNDTAITFTYKLAFVTENDIGMAAAMSVVNILLLLVLVLAYMRTVDVDEGAAQ
jgi:multiple sugar transport system permease protein